MLNLRILFAIGLVAVVSSCSDRGSESKDKQVVAHSKHNIKSAKATLNPTKGSKVKGNVSFKTVQDGVLVVADVEGLTPGRHGFHIHEYGDCSAPDASSAGAHYNPTNKKHAGPHDSDRHEGDLGNIEADEKGHGHYERVDKVLSLSGPYAIVGKSVIVHEKEDNFITQPSGDSGSRQACGVIVGIE